MEKIYIGIDPSMVKPTSGTGGAIVLSKGYDFVCIRLNQTRADVALQFRQALSDFDWTSCQVITLLEQVSAGPNDGRASAFKFGEGFGFLKGMLITMGVPFDTITPAKWMSPIVGRRSRSMSRTMWKNRLKGKAQQLFASESINLANADAYLLCYYAKRYYDAFSSTRPVNTSHP